MKQTVFPALIALVLAGAVFSCKKKTEEPVVETPYACAACARTPEALAANDNTAKGIYKGTVAGSSGTVKFDLANSGTAMTAYLTIDGVSATLTSTVTYTAGQPIIGNFTGTWPGTPGGAVSVSFAVGATGGTPTVTSSSIPGHPNATFTIYKEQSNNLIEAFEGTYTKPSASGTETGVFNILISRQLGLLSGLAKRNGSSSAPGTLSGTVSGNTLTFTGGSGTNVTGTTSGDNVSGNITDQYGTGTYTGHRTL